MHGEALVACSCCGHTLTGVLWTLEPPRVLGRGGPSRLFLQITVGLLAAGVASFVLFGLIEAEREALQHAAPALSTRRQALRPAPPTGRLPGKNAPAVAVVNPGASLHPKAPARPPEGLANPDGGGGP